MSFPGIIEDLDLMDLIPGYLAARLEADPFFCDIPIIVADKGNAEAMVAEKMAVLAEKNKKSGVAVIVLPLISEDDYPNQPYGPLKHKPSFQIIELREINRGENGTKKTWRKVARRIHNVIKPFAMPGIFTELTGDTPLIEEIPLGKLEGQNLIGGQVNYKCFECDSDKSPTQVETPFIDEDGVSFTITCETPTATIYYTLDGSFPWSGNDSAKPYTDTVAIPAEGAVVMACGYAPEMIASYVSRAIVTPD